MQKARIKLLLISADRQDTEELCQKLANSLKMDFLVEVSVDIPNSLEILVSRRFDAILMDLTVPGSTGISTLKEVIEKASDIPVIVISTDYVESQSLETVRVGAQDYLIKSRLNSSALERILLYCIERQRRTRDTAIQYATSTVLNKATSLRQAASDLLRILCNFLGCGFAILWTADPSAVEFRCFHSYGPPKKECTELELATAGTSFPTASEFALARRSPRYTEDIDQYLPPPLALAAVKDGFRSALVFPIMIGAETIAIMEFLSRELQSLDDDLLKVATNIANQVGQFMARKLAEQEKERLTNEHLLILNSASEGIYGVDMQGHITFMNRAAAEMLQCDPGEVNGKNFHQLFHHSNADGSPYTIENCPLQHVFETGKGYQTNEEHFWRTDGAHFAVEYSAFPIVELGRIKGIVTCFNDITQRRRMEVDLRHAQKLEAVGKLAAGIAHEINTPIQFIGDNARFLQDSFRECLALWNSYETLFDAVGQGLTTTELLRAVTALRKEIDWLYLKPEIPKALEQMLDGIGRVAGIVRAMKEFSHVDRTVEKTAGDINKALESTLVVARNELKYVADVKTELGSLPVVMCHPGDLNQVFLNLMVNAAQAIGDVVKGTDKRGQITICTKLVGDWVEIAVSDTGTGIAESIKGNVFEPFFTTKEVGKGTGQGLAMARAIVVEKHGGSLTFETELGKGTTFFVRLPVN